MTPLYQAPSARTAWLERCLPSPLHLLQPPPPLCYILLFSPLFISLLPLSSLFHTPILSPPPPPLPTIITPASQPPLFYLHSQLITLPSSCFSYSHFFLQKTFVRALHYLLWGERSGYRGRCVGQTKWAFEVRFFLSYVSVHTPLLFKHGYWKCLVLS